MKKELKISLNLSQFNEKHTIYLGNNEYLKHYSKTFLKSYLRTYKKVLMDNLRIINNHNAEIQSLFRNFYFDVSSSDSIEISNLLNDFNRSLNWIFSNIGGDQNSIIFNKIDSCITYNLEILNILKYNSEKNKNYSLKNQVHAYKKMHIDFCEIYNREKKSLELNVNYLN